MLEVIREAVLTANPDSEIGYRETKFVLHKFRIDRSGLQFIMPGGGMSMWPPPFLWLTITGRCWRGVLRLTSLIASGHRGIGMPET